MPNKLQHETSAYLLQHAENPVNWYPWDTEALSLAKNQDKPILLSIGYSACHWCHVMAHESFEDETTAQLMNSGFINIKVDKEERPDLDKIYQTAHQVINQRPGGWPLTVILDPHTLLPFFAGTYFPKEARFGLLAFNDILPQIIDFYQQEKPKLQEHQQQMRGVFTRLSAEQTDNTVQLSAAPLATATQQLLQLHDKHNGGFGKQPKFPQPSYLQRLLKYSFYDLTQQKSCLPALYTTLNKMALGGLYDHLGGGFFRYSVDAAWQIPHFEKMLYDNAQLLTIYSDIYAINNSPLFAHHIQQTAEWVINEMQASHGGYYATLDADSEGQEGKFYVWDAAEVSKLLSAEEYTAFSETFGLNQRPNFENHWHLRVLQLNAYPPKENSILASACSKLLQARAQRVRPHRDEKIITSWNGLMIKGMAKAGLMLQNPRYIESANQAVDFIYKHLWKNGRLLSTYQQNTARFNGYLDDYAYLLDGVLTLLSVQWSSAHLQFAIELADALIENFWDNTYHGFFFTSHDHETLIYRPKPLTDEAIPSGNGVAAHALLKLGYLLSEPRYLTIAEQALTYAMPSIEHLPYLHSTLLDTLEDFLHPPKLAIIRGTDAELFSWRTALKAHVSSHEWIYAVPNDTENLPAALKEKKATQQAVVYICQGMQCSAPMYNIKELL